MTRTEMNKLAMYHAVEAVFDVHQPVIEPFLPLQEAVACFKSGVKAITSRNQEHSGTSGATAAKNSAIAAMIDKGYSIANALFLYGRKSDDEEIKAACRLTQSDFNHFNETDLEKCCTTILTLAQVHAAELVTYRISSDDITSLQTSLETYRKKSDIRDDKSAGSKVAREVLFQLFASIDETLKEDIDRMMDGVKSDNIDFYNKYFAARVIKDFGGSHTKTDKNTETSTNTAELAEVSAK
jgi:hypothetical protein